MVLHGLDLAIADVDLVLAPEDAALVLQEHGCILPSSDESGPYRSDVFGRIEGGPLPIEILGGFHAREDDRWVAVRPVTRLEIGLAKEEVFVPSLLDLASITRRLGRPKDVLRAEMLEALSKSRTRLV